VSAEPRLGLLFLGRRPAARFTEVARHAERAGFDAFWIPDERFFREVYALCSLVANATSTLLVGPCVTDPYTRHPALTAMATATLDELSRGRALLGIGAGVSGFSQLALARRRPARAVAEAIELIDGLLGGEHVDYAGEIFSFSGKLDFQPPRAHVPVYVAAAGPRMLDVAGRQADGVIIEGCTLPQVLRPAVARVQDAARRAGRDPSNVQIVARVDVALDAGIERARDALRPRIARHLINAAPGFERFAARGIDVPAHLRAHVDGLGYTHDAALLAAIGADLPAEYIDAFCIAATQATLGSRLDALCAAGADQIIINPVEPADDRVEPIIDSAGEWLRSRQSRA
jgi:5,10-methylenetetrahydromethanopterin reductase